MNSSGMLKNRVVGNRQEERKRDYHGYGSATDGTEEVGEGRGFGCVLYLISIGLRFPHGSGNSQRRFNADQKIAKTGFSCMCGASVSYEHHLRKV
jgi:hypothetical protein